VAVLIDDIVSKYKEMSHDYDAASDLAEEDAARRLLGQGEQDPRGEC